MPRSKGCKRSRTARRTRHSGIRRAACAATTAILAPLRTRVRAPVRPLVRALVRALAQAAVLADPSRSSGNLPNHNRWMWIPVDPASSGEIRHQNQRRRNEKELRSGESIPEHRVPAHELYKESEDRVREEIDLEQVSLDGDARPPVREEPNEHRGVKYDFIDERRMQRDAGNAVRTIRDSSQRRVTQPQAPGKRRRSTDLLRQKAPDPPDRHSKRHRRREQIA